MKADDRRCILRITWNQRLSCVGNNSRTYFRNLQYFSHLFRRNSTNPEGRILQGKVESIGPRGRSPKRRNKKSRTISKGIKSSDVYVNYSHNSFAKKRMHVERRLYESLQN